MHNLFSGGQLALSRHCSAQSCKTLCGCTLSMLAERATFGPMLLLSVAYLASLASSIMHGLFPLKVRLQLKQRTYSPTLVIELTARQCIEGQE